MRRAPSDNLRYPAIFSQTYLALAAENGIDKADILREANIPYATGISEWGLNREEFQCLLDAMIKHFGQQGIGLEMGWRLPPTAFGSLGHAIMACHNLGEALRLCEKFWTLFGMGMSYTLKTAEEHCTIEISALPEIPTRHKQMVLESTLASLYKGYLILLPSLKSQTHIWFSFPQPTYYAKACDLLGDVHYDMPTCQIRIPSHLLDEPLAMSNPFGFQSAIAQCEQQFALRQHPGIAGRVQQALVLSAHGYPNVEMIAEKLHISPRTLRRHLKSEGANFQTLLNNARKRDAMALLANSSQEIQNIANTLGYTDPANFTRAFKQWSGQTPRAYRESVNPTLSNT